jgi:hypothetical protein
VSPTSFFPYPVSPNFANLVLTGPYYTKGCAIGCAIGCGFTGPIAILSLGLVITLHHENKRKGRLFGEVDEAGRFDISAEGDKHPQFRYLL